MWSQDPKQCQSSLLYNSFWKANKKKSLLYDIDMFFIYLETYTVLKTDEQLFRWHLFLCRICWSMNYKDGSQLFDFCFLSLSCHTEISLCVWIEWLRCVCVFVFCVCVCCECEFVSMCMSDWHDGLYCQWIAPVLQVRKGRGPLVKKRENHCL